MYHLVPLNRLASGRNGRVAQILGHPEDVRRVNELGIRDGIHVEIIRSGMPCIIRTGMQTLCIRGNELLNVLVEPGVDA
jgi:Fe2+ transport system protein FeoA